mgnify:CR=1 FL=1
MWNESFLQWELRPLWELRPAQATMTNKAYGTEGALYVQVTDTIQLASSDTLEIRVASDGTTPALVDSNEFNRVTVKKISN